jgi:hypothetical protein
MLKVIFKDKTGGLGQYEITEPYKEVVYLPSRAFNTLYDCEFNPKGVMYILYNSISPLQN